MLGWPEEQVEALLHMQYEAQRISYRNQFPAARHQLVMYGSNAPIGQLITHVDEREVRLVAISLLPEYRGRGFGVWILQHIQQFAAGLKLPVTLHVQMGNPAQRLYARCGFRVTCEAVSHVAMQWDAMQAIDRV